MSEWWLQLYRASIETLYMVLFSGSVSVLLGLALGVLLFATRQGQHWHNPWVQYSVGALVNITRSIPYIVLMIVIMPLTRLIAGVSIGTTAACVPLVFAASPFVARLVETALNEVPKGLLEAGRAMGASYWQVIFKVLLPEALPGIISGITITLITLVGYSAMAGAMGAGGLGTLAIDYGVHRFEPDVLLAAVVVLVLMVQVLQWMGDTIIHRILRR